MTLIVNCIHKHQAFMAVDSRLSAGGEPVEEDAIKCAHIVCGEGKLLLGFTGIAEVENKPTMDWVLHQFSGIDLKQKTAEELLETLAEKLTHNFQQTYYRNPPKLIIAASGWADASSRHPKLLSVGNCLDDKGKYTLAKFEFRMLNYAVPSHGAALVVLGDLSATKSANYKVKVKRVSKLLNINSNDLDESILDGMIDVVVEASYDPASTTINNRVRAGRIHRKKEGMIYKAVPQERDYSVPGFATPNMVVSGIRIKNDFVDGGTTVIGGHHR